MSDRIIVSPLPGIFYRKPNPQAPPYVVEGQRVRPGDIIGLVEVMKTFHEVKAEVEGVVKRFLVENEAAVNIGDPLVELE